jgi:hypothetical protein
VLPTGSIEVMLTQSFVAFAHPAFYYRIFIRQVPCQRSSGRLKSAESASIRDLSEKSPQMVNLANSSHFHALGAANICEKPITVNYINCLLLGAYAAATDIF